MSEIIIVQEEEKTLRFYDIHDNQEHTYCNVNINIKKFYYNQDIHVESVRYYYDITYKYRYIECGIDISLSTDFNPYSLTTIKPTNPFYYYKDKISDDSLEGVIALSNRVTDALVEQLMMDDYNLERELCNIWIVQYRTHLMYILSTLWN
tara:strand:- start:107 stop:556 length:450 start_codon:yes stop_codon:yes gene_type:complete